MSKLSRLTRNSLIIAFFFLIDKVLAFVRTGIISRQYSDSVHMLDTFNAANNLPDVLFALISGGALAMAFIPLLTEYLTTKDRAAAWDLFSRVANVAFLVTGSIAILIAIFAQPIVDAKLGIAPGFGAEQRKLLAELMRLNLIGIGDGFATSESTFYFSRNGTQHVQHRADLRRNFSRAAIWCSWIGLWCHPRRGNAFAHSSAYALQVRLPLDTILEYTSHGFDRSLEINGAAFVDHGRHSDHSTGAR